MGDPRVRIFGKILLDLIFFVLVLSVYFIEVFEYMNDFYVGTTVMLKEKQYQTSLGKETPMTETIIASYSEFDDHFCDNPTPRAKPVCDKRKDFETAGILFLVFSCLSHCFMFYGMLGLTGMSCGCSCCGLLRMTFVHYVYPAVYAIALVLYIAVSGLFSLDVPSDYSDDNNKMKPQAGLILMFAAFPISIISLIYFLCNRTQLKSLLLVTHEGYAVVKT